MADTCTAVSVGTFDGVHLGHAGILKALRTSAVRGSIESLIVTFDPHPRTVLFPDELDMQLLTTTDEKIHLLEKEGIDRLLVIPFTREFAALDYSGFIRSVIIEKLQAKVMIIGFNHHFGSNREGDFEKLSGMGEMLGFEVHKVEARQKSEKNVSSTRIRKELFAGNISIANELLGYQYLLTGEVVAGNRLGNQLGFPTANIRPTHDAKLVPTDGVYAVLVEIDGKKHRGMMNIGSRPTFHIQARAIEVHIIDFEEAIYGKIVRIEFVNRLRPVIKFETTEALIRQLHLDKQKTISLLQ
ncbi:MAG: bifunctional riboflavin kinase/FAD synthetase [Bacteroidetes bacterium]|nr:bifunctional riboflavin kinase/FAD synthetase [Bacteroidota bacterium]